MSSSSVIPKPVTFAYLMASTLVLKIAKGKSMGGIEVCKDAAKESAVDLKIVAHSARYTTCALALSELSKAIVKPISMAICVIQPVPGLISHEYPCTLIPINVMDEDQYVTPLQKYVDGRFSIQIL